MHGDCRLGHLFGVYLAIGLPVVHNGPSAGSRCVGAPHPQPLPAAVRVRLQC